MLYYLIAYGCYFLGATIFTLDLLAKYQLMADAHPDDDITFNSKEFWKKERFNLIKVILLGFATLILLIPLEGISLDFINNSDEIMFSVSAKTLMFPVYLILGWSGGRGTIALAGQYKKGFYKKMGIEEN